MSLPPRHQDISPFWAEFCERFLRTSPKLARELWGALRPSATVMWQVLRCDAATSPDAIMHFAELGVTPQTLFQATLSLSPEGKPRRWDILRLERTILELTGKDGRWL